LIDVRATTSRFFAACNALFSRGESTILAGSSGATASRSNLRAVEKHRDQIKRRLQREVKDDYIVEDSIGGGSMGDVFRARHRRLGTLCAIKVLAARLATDSTQVERFFREARVGASLKHPNIVWVMDCRQSRDLAYLVMNYVEGTDLETLSTSEKAGGPEKRRQWSPADVIAVATQVAQALEVAHAHNVIHRDLKPSNICVDYSGKVVILDFGIAHLSAGAKGGTLSGEVLGTPLYMSPEQAQGQSQEVDARSDLYSLGVIMYEMLAGINPFEAPNPQSVLLRHITYVPPPVIDSRSDVPPALSKAVQRLLHKDPLARYQSATELRLDLVDMADRPTKKKKKAAGESPAAIPLAGLVAMESILHRNPQARADRAFTPEESRILDLCDSRRSIQGIIDSAGLNVEEAMAAVDSLRKDGVVYIGIPGIPREVEEKAPPHWIWRPLAMWITPGIVAAIALAAYFAMRGPTVPQLLQVDASPFASVTIRTQKGAFVTRNDTPFRVSLAPGTYTVEFVSGQQRRTETVTIGSELPQPIRADFWTEDQTRELLHSYR
jgi:serine/threonine protein kinase